MTILSLMDKSFSSLYEAASCIQPGRIVDQNPDSRKEPEKSDISVRILVIFWYELVFGQDLHR